MSRGTRATSPRSRIISNPAANALMFRALDADVTIGRETEQLFLR